MPADPAPLTTDLYLDGEPRPTDDVLTVADPAYADRIVGHAAAATPEDVHDAVTAARAAFPDWASRPVTERAAALSAAVAMSDADHRADAELLTRENGKVLAESMRDVSMLARRTGQVTSLADRVDDREVLDPEAGFPTRTEIGWQPLGVVTIIVPFNWPVGILSTALPHALLAGNTVIVKPPPSAPLATTRIVQRMATGLPPGVLNVITGPDAAMTGLVRNPDIAKICFTGSTAGGRKIMELASGSLTRVTLELGGNDPALVLADAELTPERLDRMFAAIYTSTGQVCMNIKRLFVHRSRYAEVVGALTERLQRVRLGHGLDPQTTMGPLHTTRQRDFTASLIAQAQQSGAEVHQFGELPGGDQAGGNFLRPALVLDPDPALDVVTEEPFGPVVPVLPFDDAEAALAQANAGWAGLGASVWTADRNQALAYARRLVCGYVWLNDHGSPRLDLRAPFGGMKQSGIGREQGIAGIRSFQDTRAIAELIEDGS
ncbi:MAG: aldehyde dehydrogenase family protein [Propioniciclava sp.]